MTHRAHRPAILFAKGALCLLLATMGLLLLACDDPMSLEEMRIEIEPKSMYRVQWDAVEECAQLYGDFDRIRWFTTPHFPEGNGILGQWNARHEITFLEGAEFNVQVIRHEILHELLDGDGEHVNPRWEWCEIPTGVDG